MPDKIWDLDVQGGSMTYSKKQQKVRLKEKKIVLLSFSNHFYAWCMQIKASFSLIFNGCASKNCKTDQKHKQYYLSMWMGNP